MGLQWVRDASEPRPARARAHRTAECAAAIGSSATEDEVVPMPRFVIFFAYTPETWARMAEQPGDRTAAVRAAAEAVGARLEALYWMRGEADGRVLLEAPDAQTAAAVTLTSATTVAVRSLGTH